MQKVRWSDKLIVDELKAKGYIFGYSGGALQYEHDFGVDWRGVLATGVALPPARSSLFDPTKVEAEIFKTSIKGWDELKRSLKREALINQKKEDEFYRQMSRVVHLDLYALSQSLYSVFRLSQQRTHGTTEEYVDFVLKVYKRPTFVFYDDDMEHFSDWMYQRGLEAKKEFYVCFKIFPTLKKTIKFIQDHPEDILHWEKNYERTTAVIRRWRALCRDLRWSDRRKVFPDVPEPIETKLRETYDLLQEAKEHLQECESIKAAEKANIVAKNIVAIRRSTRSKNTKKAS